MNSKQTAQQLIYGFRQKAYEGYVFPDDINPAREARHNKKGAELALMAVSLIEGFEDGQTPFWRDVRSELETVIAQPTT